MKRELQTLTSEMATVRFEKDVAVDIVNSNVEGIVQTTLGEVKVSIAFEPTILASTDPNTRHFVASQVMNRLQQAVLKKALGTE